MARHDAATTGSSTYPYVTWPPPGLIPDDLLRPVYNRYELRWSAQRKNADLTGATVTVQRSGVVVPTAVTYRADRSPGRAVPADVISWTVDEAIVAGATYEVVIGGVVVEGQSQPEWAYRVDVFDTASYEETAEAGFGTIVDRVFLDFTGEPPTPNERRMWSAQIRSAGDQALLVSELATSPEFASIMVNRMYLDTLDRTGDSVGVDYWVDQIRSGIPIRTVAASFYGSAEYVSRYGGGDHELWLEDLYVKLLDREPDAAGLAYWVDETARMSP
ncbi:MAG: hypothetical protein ACI8TP_000645 [Acidimicrobiales bacterium]|jgi:hypothetical protein